MIENQAMELIVNGKTVKSGSKTLAELLSDMQLHEEKGIAVALNDRVISRSGWTSEALSAGDRVTIIRATAGG